MKIKRVQVQKTLKTDKGLEMVGTIYTAPAIPDYILREVEADTKNVFLVVYDEEKIVEKKRETKKPPPADESKPTLKKTAKKPRKRTSKKTK